MKNKTYLLNMILAGLTTLGLLGAVLVRTFIPAAILPALSIPKLVLISLAALLLEWFLAHGGKHSYPSVAVLSLVSFLVLPWASGLLDGAALIKLAAGGCVVFTAVTWLFDSMAERITSGHESPMAAVISALGIFLASQAFSGILL